MRRGLGGPGQDDRRARGAAEDSPGGAAAEKAESFWRLRSAEDNQIRRVCGLGDNLVRDFADANLDADGLIGPEEQPGQFAQGRFGFGAESIIDARLDGGDIEIDDMEQGDAEGVLHRHVLHVNQGVGRPAHQVERNKNAFAIHGANLARGIGKVIIKRPRKGVKRALMQAGGMFGKVMPKREKEKDLQGQGH